MNTVQDTGSRPIAVPFGERTERSRQDTLPPEPAPGMLGPEAALLLRSIETAGRVVDSLSGAVKQGRGGPGVGALLISLFVSVVVSGGLWVAHMATGDRQILDRLDALEDAQEASDDHNAWVVDALVALSQKEPLPPPPKRRFRRRGAR